MVRISILFFLFCTLTVFSQKVEFGDVTAKDFELEKDDTFPDADAVLLYYNIDLDYGRALYVHEKVRIFSKDGYDFANWEIPFDDAKGIKAYTYNFEGNAVVKTKVTSESIFKEEIAEDYEIKKIAFPNVREGSIIEIKYKVPFIGLYSIYTQHYLPIKNLRINVNNPVRASIEIMENPFVKLPIKRVETDYNYLFTGNNIPGLRREPYVSNINNHRGLLMIELYGQRRANSYTWAFLANRLNKSIAVGDQLRKTMGFFKKDLERVLSGATDPLEKAKKIDAFLKRTMEWNKYYSKGSENIKTAYWDKKGSSGEINLLLIAMLREAGLKANPMLVASKSRGWIMYPRYAAFNNLMCALEIDDEIYLMDASREKLDFAQLPLAFINDNGLIVYPDGTSLRYPTQTKKHSKNTVLISAEIDPSTGDVSGKVRKQITDYFAWVHRERYGENSGESYKKTMERIDLFTLSNLDRKNFEKPPKPISMSYDFEYESYVEQIGDKLYFQPLLNCGLKAKRFTDEDRLYPIDFEHPYKEKFIINYTIPDGYKVESLPAGIKVPIQDNVGSLIFNATEQSGKIQIALDIQFNQSLIDAKYYPGIKALFSEYANITNSKIVLVAE